MKKFISVGLITLCLLAVSSRISFAQSVTIRWTTINPVLDHEGMELAQGAAVMVLFADSADLSQSIPELNSAYFIGSSSTNSLGDLSGVYAGYNPLPYNPMLGGFGGFTNVRLDTPDYQDGADNTVNVFIRVFDNISSGAFDANGNYNGSQIADQKYGSTVNSYYFDTDIFSVAIPENPLNDTPVVIDIGGMQANIAFPMGGMPVPEPSAMMLAGFGIVGFIIRKFKKN